MGAEEARRHDFVAVEERSFVPGMPEARRTCGLVLWCLRRGISPVVVEEVVREQALWPSRRERASRHQEAVEEPGIWALGVMDREEASAPCRQRPAQPSQTFLVRVVVVERRLVVVPEEVGVP